MRMCRKRALSFLLMLALIAGCFAGTGVTAKATGVPYINSISVDKESLDSNGGSITVSVDGSDLGENVWWGLRRQTESGKEVVGDEVRVAQTDGSNAARFTVEIPANESGSEVVYEIRVKESEPQKFDWQTSYSWGTPLTKTITVDGKEGGTVDKTKLTAQIQDAESRDEKDYKDNGKWEIMQEKLKAAKEVNENEAATAQEVKTATDELQAAINALEERIPFIKNISVNPEYLGSDGGRVTVSLTGEDLKGKVWYMLQKEKEDGTYEIVGEEKNIASIAGGISSEFVINIAPNDDAREVTYKLKIKDQEPTENWTGGSFKWNWSGANEATFAVEAKGGIVDKTELRAKIQDAESRDENDYKDAGKWTVMQEKLAVAKRVNEDDTATAQQVNQAADELKKALDDLASSKKVPAIFNIEVSPESLKSTGGKVEVSLTGEDLTNKVWYLLRKKQDDASYEVIGEEKNVADIAGGSASVFVIDIPENKEDKEVTYQIKVNATEPTESFFGSLKWNWQGASECTVKVSAETGSPSGKVDKSALDLVIKEAEAKKAEDYVADGNWAAMQEKLAEAREVFANGEATKDEVENAAQNLSNALKSLVKKDTETEEAILKAITVSPESLTSSGGTVNVTVTGENMAGTFWYQVRKQTDEMDGTPIYGEESEIKSMPISNSTSFVFPVEIQANTDSADVSYQVRVSIIQPSGTVMRETKAKRITVSGTGTSSDKVDKTALAAAIEEAKAKNAEEYVTDNNWNTMQEKLNAAKTVNAKESATAQEVKTALDELQAALKNLVKKPEKTANITKITATPTEIPATGGTVQLSVTGTEMTKDNWGLDIKTFISGTNQTQPASDKAGKATVKEMTENSAVVEISANGMKNDVDFVISAGPKNGEEITKQAEVTVVQAGKGYTTTSLTPESVVLADDHTVVATFKSVITAVEGADLNKLVYIADADGNNRHDLTDAGKVTIDDQTVAVEYSESLKDIGTTSYLYIKEGALKTTIMESGSEAEKVVADIKWIIQTAARVSGIKVDKDLFDSNGGTVTATLNGYRVEDIELDKIEASIYRPGETSASDIAVTKDKDADGRITLTFAVPKNTTQNTVSYWLNVKYDGTPVYESAADSRGQRTTISVLPEGKTEKDRTLSMVTISGNNKTEVNNTTDIEVQVSSNVGELKTELRVYGTNLDSALTKVRAVDENGIIWPVYQISECDGTWRFIAIAGPHRNGVFGDGNSQLIELLPPRYAGTNKTYKIQVAIDGENFIEEPCVTLKVLNENIKGEYEFRDCTDKNFKYVTVQYVDESGKEIAEKDVYKGYSISMPEGFGIKPKQINGYTLVEEPTLDEWVEEGRTYSYIYKSTNTDPVVNPKPPVVSQSIKVSGIKINAASKKIAAGKKVQLSATVSPANASNKAVTWKSSNTKYATVNSSGKVTVKKAGAGKSVTITAIAADGSGKKASCKLQIMKNSVKSVKIKGAKTVKAGKKLKLKAQVKTTGKKVNKKLKWTCSNTKYATVTSGGVVKTKKAGKGKSVKITAAATDGSNKKSTVKIKIK